MAEEVVLVTGGTGYIASDVIKLLQQEGYKVRTTVRDAKNETKVKHLNQLCPDAKHLLEIVEANLLQADSWTPAVEGCTYVVHVASPFVLVSPSDEDEVIKPAVDGTLNVLKACAAAKTVKRVVLTSSAAAIRGGVEPPREEPYTEKDWLDTEDSRNTVYVRSKALAEKAAWKFVEELPEGEKFELAVVNPTLVLGPVSNGTSGSSVEIVAKMMRRDYPALPQFQFQVCDVRDVAVAHLRCMTLPQAAGNRHIIMTTSVWMKDMADILAKEFTSQGYRIPTAVMPNFVTTLASFFNKELRQARNFGKPVKLSNTKMIQDLGITPIPLEKTLVEMGHSMIEKGFIPRTDKYTGPSGSF